MIATIDDFIGQLPPAQAAMVEALHQYIMRLEPRLTMRMAYQVPYYYLKRRVCFVWPSAVQPGPQSGVDFGICQGHLLPHLRQLMQGGRRKQVLLLSYQQLQDIDWEVLHTVLVAAIACDAQF